MDFYLFQGIKVLFHACKMVKKINCCKSYCKRWSNPSMPSEDSGFGAKKISNKAPLHWIIVFISICVLGAWLIPEIQKNEDFIFDYFPPKIDLLRRKDPAIKISGIDFVSESMKEKMQALGDSMYDVCSKRSDDVVFAFQFGKARRREDHVFALCSGYNTRIFGNAEVIGKNDEYVMCTEEYDGELHQVKRPSSVSIKAIDIKEWEPIEYDSSDVKEACILQHAIDVLESKWV
jgi:peptide deformylase